MIENNANAVSLEVEAGWFDLIVKTNSMTGIDESVAGRFQALSNE